MMISSSAFMFPVMDNALGVNPKMLELPTLLSEDALVDAVHEAVPILPPRVDDFASTPGLVPDDGSSQSSISPPCSPEFYEYLHLSQHDYFNPGPPDYPSTSAPPESSQGPLTDAPCAEGKPIKEGDGYRCSICNTFIKRRDDFGRHAKSKRIPCKYCGKFGFDREYNQIRHLRTKRCLELWKAGYDAGRFTEHSVEDAYRH